MKEKLKRIFLEHPEISDWRITDYKILSTELFYVADRLETTRRTERAETEVTVYVDKDDKRGEATALCYDYMTYEELKEKIEDAVYSASFAMNRFYEIPEPSDREIPEMTSNLKGKDFREVMDLLVDAVFRADCHKNGYLSATEFFLKEKTVRIMNSRGIDVTQTYYTGNVELIPSWKTEKDDVETYHWISFENFDPEAITKETEEKILQAKARHEAVKPELSGSVKVILQEEDVSSIFWYYAYELSYQGKYDGSNRYEIGDCLQGNEVTGDKINLKLTPFYPGAVDSYYVDGNGIIMSELELIRDGIALNRFGSFRTGYYLGIKEPTGYIPVAVVREGTKSISEMKAEPYLHIVQFSDMQVDPDSGFFGGEVRLGYYFDGEKEYPVTGISVSGNIRTLGGKMRFSSESTTIHNYHGPKYLEVTMEVFG